MRHHLIYGLTSLVAVTGLAAPARAEFVLNVPFVSVQVGRAGGVRVGTPWVTVQAPRPVVVATPYAAPIIVNPPARLPSGAPVEVAPAPAKIGDPILVPLPKPGQTDFSVPVPLPLERSARPMSHREFASAFKPAGGAYEVAIVHPLTNQVVNVNFRLPTGEPRVRVLPRQITFDYGRDAVTIRFLPNGQVRVTN